MIRTRRKSDGSATLRGGRSQEGEAALPDSFVPS